MFPADYAAFFVAASPFLVVSTPLLFVFNVALRNRAPQAFPTNAIPKYVAIFSGDFGANRKKNASATQRSKRQTTNAAPPPIKKPAATNRRANSTASRRVGKTLSPSSFFLPLFQFCSILTRQSVPRRAANKKRRRSNGRRYFQTSPLELRRFLIGANFYRRFNKRGVSVCAPYASPQETFVTPGVPIQ